MARQSANKPILAVTGGTGFVGQHFIKAATKAGYSIRALTRSPRLSAQNIEWITGDIQSPETIATLLNGASTVIHIAGLTKALRSSEFLAVNSEATAKLAKAAANKGCKIIHISSLAAREPNLSYYAESKSYGDQSVAASGAYWTILRPPAVYGPLDTEMMPIWKWAQKGLLFCPKSADNKISLLYVSDLVAAIMALIDAADVQSQIFELDDGYAGGYSYRTLAAELGIYFNKKITLVPLPSLVVKTMGLISSAQMTMTKTPRILSLKKTNELLHPDWSAQHNLLNNRSIWKPKISLQRGLSEIFSNTDPSLDN